jgi:hypothetical protein
MFKRQSGDKVAAFQKLRAAGLGDFAKHLECVRLAGALRVGLERIELLQFLREFLILTAAPGDRARSGQLAFGHPSGFKLRPPDFACTFPVRFAANRCRKGVMA